MSEWIDEDLAPVNTLTLEAAGVRVGKSLVPWGAVLGALALPAEGPKQLYLLAPRRPPAPPWFTVTSAQLPAELREEGLSSVAQRIEERAKFGSYRDHAVQRPVLRPSELLSCVVSHAHLPGALEVPLGRGPGSGFNRFFAVAASATAGSATAAVTALVVAPSLTGMLLGAGAAAGAAAPWGYRHLQRQMRHRPRVLVLAPDGCVIGFPSGVRSFSWSDIERFGETDAALPGRSRPLYPHLEVTLRATETQERDPQLPAAHTSRARLAGAWFDAPLPLIVRVAEAYRIRMSRTA